MKEDTPASKNLDHEKVITPLPTDEAKNHVSSEFEAELQAMKPKPDNRQPQTPRPAPTGPITSRSEMIDEKEPKARNYKQWALLGGLGLALLVMLIALLIGLKVITFGTLKTITYQNKDAKYEMLFFSKYITDKMTDDEESGIQLVSQYSKNHKAPVILNIVRVKNSENTTNYENFKDDCTASAPKVATVRNKHLDQDIAICSVTTNEPGEDYKYMYIAVAKDQTYNYFILIMQDNITKVTTKAEAQELLDKTGLDAYDTEIKKIVGSIKPLE